MKLKQPWIDSLPRKIKTKERCAALDSQGNRCENTAVFEDRFHGDPEIVYDERVQWVRIAVCRGHLESRSVAEYYKDYKK